MKLGIMRVFLVVRMLILQARPSSQEEQFTPSFTKRSGGADWIATSKWGKRATLKVVASKNDHNSGEGYPMYFGDRHSLQVEGYTDGDQDDRYDRADGDRSDRTVLSLERLPLEITTAVENEGLKDGETKLEDVPGLQLQEVNVEIGDILKKIMIIMKEPNIHKAQPKRSSPEFQRIQYIIRNLCARLRAVEDLTDWYPVFSFNNHNKITEQDYRMIQICKKMGMKRNGSPYGPRSLQGPKPSRSGSPRGPRSSRSGKGSSRPRGPRSADPDTGKPTFGKMFMRM